MLKSGGKICFLEKVAEVSDSSCFCRLTLDYARNPFSYPTNAPNPKLILRLLISRFCIDNSCFDIDKNSGFSFHTSNAYQLQKILKLDEPVKTSNSTCRLDSVVSWWGSLVLLSSTDCLTTGCVTECLLF